MKILLLALSLITPEETTWVRVNAPEGISFLFPNAPQKITKNVDGIPTVIYQTKDLACVAGVVCSDLSAKHLRMDGKMALQIYENMKAATLEMETVVLRDEMTVPYDNMLIKEIQYSITKDNHELTYYKRFIFRDNHIINDSFLETTTSTKSTSGHRTGIPTCWRRNGKSFSTPSPSSTKKKQITKNNSS